MKITVIGTGYVGLVTGVCLSQIGHHVTCIDFNLNKIQMLQAGQSPIYEPGLEDLINENIKAGRLLFTDNYATGVEDASAIYIAVGTPSMEDGTADLSSLEQAAREIARHLKKYTVIITKSTVPIGTNDKLRVIIQENKRENITFDMVSNPEFLREGSAINDTFNGDRIIIGADSQKARDIVDDINKPFNIPVYHTTIRSAEMIKYASNAFLATKISFINEISNLCSKLDANIDEVAYGMGLDQRIGMQFLKAGIGYGGSCFPKDTKALVQIAGDVKHRFDLLEAVIRVNNEQRKLLIELAQRRFGTLKDKRIALLGLSFKPNTDDMREAPSLTISQELIERGASVVAYDPISNEIAKKELNNRVTFVDSLEDALERADCAFILTEWDQFRNMNLEKLHMLMNEPLIFDGRNCFSLETMQNNKIEYHSIGRPSVFIN
ncbi:UDP-glucose dehydrogenase family protein [Paenibacillus chitinolyticus]|uniref:UDP-glucose dehydrogenase family protein n=1 Tax=Paenibacillus chitinolyticus TaxID=79263 RepID=UPI0036700434